MHRSMKRGFYKDREAKGQTYHRKRKKCLWCWSLDYRLIPHKTLNIHLMPYGCSLVVKTNLENMHLSVRIHREKKVKTIGRARGCWPETKRCEASSRF